MVLMIILTFDNNSNSKSLSRGTLKKLSEFEYASKSRILDGKNVSRFEESRHIANILM